MIKTIDVTQEDIDRGRRSDDCYCPIALSVARTLGVMVRVTRRNIYIWDGCNGDGSYLACLPDVAHDFVDAFDRNGAQAVKPFTFEIEV